MNGKFYISPRLHRAVIIRNRGLSDISHLITGLSVTIKVNGCLLSIQISAKQYYRLELSLGMEITGIPGWVVRNFYNRDNVMTKDFRERGIDNIKKEVSESAGWILITSKDNSVASLLETGRRMERLFLKVRERNIAIHPMTQILEEPSTRSKLNQSISIGEHLQFILRTGYLKNYPQPVSLRRQIVGGKATFACAYGRLS
jgi:uncharacterized membrane protein